MPLRTLRFLKNFITNPKATGAVAPSSKWLAARMVDWMDLKGARTVVEYGPGTGSFTEYIVAHLPEQTKFFAIELNESFVETLRSRYPNIKVYQDSVANVEAICKTEGVSEVDCIICGLPWAIFPDELQDEIMAGIMKVLRPGGTFATFAYLQGLLLPAAKRFRKRLDNAFSEVKTSRTVWLNFPPALCYQCTR